MIAHRGIPDVESLKAALQTAMELEFSTIPPYLCAQWSIAGAEDPDDVASMVRSIVTQEMGHLALAGNILAALGGSPSLAMPGFVPSYPTHIVPGGIIEPIKVDLRPLSSDQLAVFMQIEFPEFRPVGLQRPRRKATGRVPRGDTIAAFYDTIADALERLSPTFQASATYLPVDGAPHEGRIASLADATAAIRFIKEQGEGVAGDPDQPDLTGASPTLSHYYAFRQIAEGRQLVQGPGGRWAYAGATIRCPAGHPFAPATTTSPLSEAFVAQFNELLVALQRCWSLQETPAQTLLGTAISLMMRLEQTGVALIASGITPPFAFDASIAYREFDPGYVRHALIPALQAESLAGSPQMIPMIGTNFSKQDALPYWIWGMLYDDWTPPAAEDTSEGSSVFFTGLEQRGDDNDNLRKRIYFSAVTPDLYPAAYREKVLRFLQSLFAPANAGQPFMAIYLKEYVNIYWDLHVGAQPDEIPDFVRQIQASFNTVLSYGNPKEQIVHENYMNVRALRQPLMDWITARVDMIADHSFEGSDKTFVHFWLQNAQDHQELFSTNDIGFEVFHNFVALSQWAHTVSLITQYIGEHRKPELLGILEALLAKAPETEVASPFPPLIRFVMEVFRLFSPNNASVSVPQADKPPKVDAAVTTTLSIPHLASSKSPAHWIDPDNFSPDRYLRVPNSAQIDREKCAEMNFARCPFDITSFPVKDGRKVELTNSGWGTVYGVINDVPAPVCDFAGFAPFGFGYRRCPGEQLTQLVFADFFEAIWKAGIEFYCLHLDQPQMLPAGPGYIACDNYAFRIRR
jgi:cytochrome P450